MELFYAALWIAGVVLAQLSRTEWAGIFLMLTAFYIGSATFIQYMFQSNESKTGNAMSLVFSYLTLLFVLCTITTMTGMSVFIVGIAARLWSVFYRHGLKPAFTTSLQAQWKKIILIWTICGSLLGLIGTYIAKHLTIPFSFTKLFGEPTHTKILFICFLLMGGTVAVSVWGVVLAVRLYLARGNIQPTQSPPAGNKAKIRPIYSMDELWGRNTLSYLSGYNV